MPGPIFGDTGHNRDRPDRRIGSRREAPRRAAAGDECEGAAGPLVPERLELAPWLEGYVARCLAKFSIADGGVRDACRFENASDAARRYRMWREGRFTGSEDTTQHQTLQSRVESSPARRLDARQGLFLPATIDCESEGHGRHAIRTAASRRGADRPSLASWARQASLAQPQRQCGKA